MNWIPTRNPGGYCGKGPISLVATWLGSSERPFLNFFRRRRCFSLMSKAACIPAAAAVLMQWRRHVVRSSPRGAYYHEHHLSGYAQNYLSVRSRRFRQQTSPICTALGWCLSIFLFWFSSFLLLRGVLFYGPRP